MSKLQVVGSHTCKDTLYAMNVLTSKGVDFDFVDISSNLTDLKVYLRIRDSHPELYDTVRAKGGVGIPAFVLADGTVTMDMEKALA